MAQFFKIPYLLFFVYLSIEAQTDYCLYPCSSNVHTVCLRKNVSCGAGPACYANFKQVALTDTDRRFMLDTHNSLRDRVASGMETTGGQPSASNMKAFSYSKELETIAQCSSNTCVFAHDKCRRTATYSWVGQNIGMASYYGGLGDYKKVMNNTIRDWYSEVNDFNNVWVGRYGGYNKTVGHYTQVVWANTQQVGCSITFFTDSDNWNNWFMACNYAAGGNVVGQTVYVAGPPAALCGTEAVNTKFSSLCGTDNIL